MDPNGEKLFLGPVQVVQVGLETWKRQGRPSLGGEAQTLLEGGKEETNWPERFECL